MSAAPDNSTPRSARMTTVEIGDNTVNAKHAKTTTTPRLPRDKASCEARGITTKKLEVVGEHPMATKNRSRAKKTEIALMLNGIDLKAFGAPGTAPVMFTLKNPGSNTKRHATLPSDEAKNEAIKTFQKLYQLRNGQQIMWLWFMDSNTRGGNIHLHGLVCPPAWMSEHEFAEMLDNIWAESLRRKDLVDAYDHETGEGACTWVQQGEAARHYNTLREAVTDFAKYEHSKYNPETGEAETKVDQKKTDRKWLATGNYRVVWAGTTVPAAPKLRAHLHCECGVADVYSLMQEHTVVPRDVREFDCRTEADKLINLDVARWSLDFLKRGATEFMEVTPEFVAAIRAIEEAHDACTAAPVAAEEVSPVPSTTPEVSTPAGLHSAVPASTATLTKGSPMTDINTALTGMFPAAVAEEMEQQAKEAFIASFPPISIAERHAELAAILADPTVLDSAKERASAETARLIELAINDLVTPDVVDEVAREARIDARAKVLAPRIEKMAEGAATIDAEDMNAFASKSLMEQVEDVLSAAAPVVMPAAASDPLLRRPFFIASLESRTDADNAYLASWVRLEASLAAFMSDQINYAEHAANYERETAVREELLWSGRMTPKPFEIDAPVRTVQVAEPM